MFNCAYRNKMDAESLIDDETESHKNFHPWALSSISPTWAPYSRSKISLEIWLLLRLWSQVRIRHLSARFSISAYKLYNLKRQCHENFVLTETMGV